MTEEALRKLVPPLEAVLFSSARPIPEKDLAELLEIDRPQLEAALAALREQAEGDGRGIRLERVGGGWRYVTRPEFDSLLRKFFEVSERSRLSLAALETLAIIAYRQPITGPEISELRGVNCSGVIRTLLEKRLVITAGKKPVVGTPFFYRTTPDFLVRFGLNDISELPRPEELDGDLGVPDGAPGSQALLPMGTGGEDEEGGPAGEPRQPEESLHGG